MSYPIGYEQFLPSCSGEPIDPTSVPGMMEMMFGEHAQEVLERLNRADFPVNSYTQSASAPSPDVVVDVHSPYRMVKMSEPLVIINTICPVCSSLNVECQGETVKCLSCGSVSPEREVQGGDHYEFV